MQYISFVGCKLPPLDGYVAVCLVLTVEVYAHTYVNAVVYLSMLKALPKFLPQFDYKRFSSYVVAA